MAVDPRTRGRRPARIAVDARTKGSATGSDGGRRPDEGVGDRLGWRSTPRRGGPRPALTAVDSGASWSAIGSDGGRPRDEGHGERLG